MVSDVLPQEEDILPLNERKQQFSFAYVRMVVAAAGCSVKTHATDYDGVDITIASSSDYATYYCPEFELSTEVHRPAGSVPRRRHGCMADEEETL
jgi:hypothetical protein